MAFFTINNEFDSYKVQLCSRASGWRGSYKRDAIITLHKGSLMVGTVTFRPESSNVKDDFYTDRNGTQVVRLEYFEQDFSKVLALLQQESPLYAGLRRTYVGNEGIGAIGTEEEPVGEEEGN